jgi:hypothetical protein
MFMEARKSRLHKSVDERLPQLGMGGMGRLKYQKGLRTHCPSNQVWWVEMQEAETERICPDLPSDSDDQTARRAAQAA